MATRISTALQRLEGIRADRLTHMEDSSQLLGAALDGGLHMVVLDMQSFGASAIPIIHLLNEEFRTPVVALVDVADDPNAVVRAGAVDVLNFFSPDTEIAARVGAAMRQAEQAGRTNLVRTGDLEYSLAADELTLDGVPVHLTRTENALFHILAQNLGNTVSDRELLETVWGPEYIGAVEYLRVFIGYIRQKIDADAGTHSLANSHIGRERGKGYRLHAISGGASRRAPEKRVTRRSERLVSV